MTRVKKANPTAITMTHLLFSLSDSSFRAIARIASVNTKEHLLQVRLTERQVVESILPRHERREHPELVRPRNARDKPAPVEHHVHGARALQKSRHFRPRPVHGKGDLEGKLEARV